MQFKIIFSPDVDEMLLRHVKFISRVSPATARHFIQELRETLQRVEQTSYQFPWHDNPNLPEHTYRKALFAKWYKLVFSVDNQTMTVYIDAVVDGRGQEG